MSSPRPQTIPYRADLDGIRGIAIALVLAYHVAPSWLPGGFTGVDVFFVLSGYLITRILIADSEPGHVRRFYARRLRRLAPALILVLGVTLVLARLTLLDDAFERLGRHTAAAAGFVANFVFWAETGYFDADALDKPLLHLWSLGIEEQFYLVWPALVWLTAARSGRRSRALGAALFFGGLSLIACLIWVRTSPDSAFYLPWFRAWQPLAGAALALLLGSRNLGARRGSGAIGWTGLFAVLIGAAILGDGRAHPGLGALLPVMGTAAMIATGESSSLGRSLSWTPVVRLGQISYALYLWHWPLLSLFGDPRPRGGLLSRIGLCLAALILAAASTRWIERPIRRAEGRRSIVWLAVLLLGSIVLGLFAARGTSELPVPRHPKVERIGQAMDLDLELRAAIPARPCQELGVDLPEEEIFCRIFADGTPDDPILLWGDSVAESWWPAVHAVAAAENRDAVVLSFSGCPPILGVRSGVYPNCDLGSAGWKRTLIEALEPSRIYVAARWGAYAGPTDDPPPERHFVSTSADGSIDLESTRSALTSRLPDTLDWLSRLAPTTVIAAVPDLVTSLPRAALLDLDPRRTVESHRNQQAFVRGLLDRTVESNALLLLVDPADRLCTGSHCEAVLDETFVYEDDNHVSAQGALRFVDLLQQAFL